MVPTAWSIVTQRLLVEHDHPVAPPAFAAATHTTLRVSRRADALVVGNVTVRIEPSESTAEVTIAVVEAVRLQGYASEVLERLVDHLLDAHRFDRVIALVPESHGPARRLFERSGFGAVARDGAELIYSRRRVTVSDQPETDRIAPPPTL